MLRFEYQNRAYKKTIKSNCPAEDRYQHLQNSILECTTKKLKNGEKREKSLGSKTPKNDHLILKYSFPVAST